MNFGKLLFIALTISAFWFVLFDSHPPAPTPVSVQAAAPIPSVLPVTKFAIIAKHMPGYILQVKLDSDIPDGLSARLVISRKFKIAVRGKTEDTAIEYFESPVTTASLKKGASYSIDSQLWADKFTNAQESGSSRSEHVIANSISKDITVFAIITDERLSGPAVKILYGAKTLSTQTQVPAPLDVPVKIVVHKKEGVSIGMSEEEVFQSTWGHPRHKNRTVTAYGISEQWVYGNGNYLYFTNGTLTSIQN